MTAQELYEQCFAQVWPLVEPFYNDKEVELLYSADTGSDAQVLTNQDLLVKVLNQLLHAALTQTLRGTEVRISLGAANQQCVISVRDHGPGMSQSQANDLYHLAAIEELGLEYQFSSREFAEFPTDHGTRITVIF